jgi:hypothetical protein
MAPGGRGARPTPGMPGVLGGPPGWRRRGCRRPPRTWRTARSRRPAARRPRPAAQAQSRHGYLLRPGLHTGTSRSAVRGRWPRARTAHAVFPGARAQPGWPRTTPARPQQDAGTPRQGRCRFAGAGAQDRSAPQRCQRRGRARRAGHAGQGTPGSRGILRSRSLPAGHITGGRPDPSTTGGL